MEVGVDYNVNGCDVISDVRVPVHDVSVRHLAGGTQIPSSSVLLHDGNSIRSIGDYCLMNRIMKSIIVWLI